VSVFSTPDPIRLALIDVPVRRTDARYTVTLIDASECEVVALGEGELTRAYTLGRFAAVYDLPRFLLAGIGIDVGDLVILHVTTDYSYDLVILARDSDGVWTMRLTEDAPCLGGRPCCE
jgi:hypothetical protein